jgi:hypothetical protein
METWQEEMKEMHEARAKGLCPHCKCEEPAKKGFKDELSEKDFRITGLCQECQDDIYADEEDD